MASTWLALAARLTVACELTPPQCRELCPGSIAARGVSIRVLRGGPVSSCLGGRKVAAPIAGVGIRGHHEGRSLSAAHVLTVVPARPVVQPVIRLIFPRAATMDTHVQREIPLFARLEGPAVVPAEFVRLARTYREAVRLCWQLRRLRNLTFRQLAVEAGLVHQHVGDYFNGDDGKHRRDLPGNAVAAVESVLGNTAISQWHAMRAQLTVVEEMQASRRAA